jgi:HEPN domain-containing protein
MEQPTQNYLALQYPQWVYQPLNLTLEEVEDPYEVLAAFFDCYTLHQSRLCLKRLLEDALNAENEQAINHLTLHDNILKLIEAAWLVLQRQPAIKKVLNTTAGDNPASILNLIVAAIRPERVFLLGTNPLDLLIVIPDDARRSLKEYETIIELANLHDETANASVIKSADLFKYLKEGNVFYSRVCQPVNVLYEEGSANPIPEPSKNLERLTQTFIRHFEIGFSRAEGFLKSAIYHQSQGENELAAFMLHQAVELAARALILTFTGKDIQTHDLNILKKHCVRCAPQLKSYFLCVANSDDRILTSLSKAYKSARYETNFKISCSELSILKEKVAVLLIEPQKAMTAAQT